MDNPISALMAQRQRLEQKEAALLARVEVLTADLTAAVGEQPISAVSDITNLDQWGEDDFVYGKLHFGGGRLSVLYRHSGDDQADAYQGVAQEDRSWQSVSLTKCDAVWREKVMTDTVLASLFKCIGERLGEREVRIDGSLTAVQMVLEAESASIDAEMTGSLAGFGGEAMERKWADLLKAMLLDPADGLTRSYAFLEELCALILHERGIKVGSEKTLTTRLRACVDALGRDETAEAKEAVMQVMHGIRTIGNGVGQLRNRFSTAHAATPGSAAPDAAYAVLMKNATAAAAIFLLNRHRARPPTPREADAAPVTDDQSPVPAS
ncbi:abortive infection family protein [Trinickia dinghuensis]|uniref:Abortive infection protein-like C-terminal domain-containing protein n=1 Tax=Trinickia dinghuensis TaxID=2291023 RepID=A0A3D8JPK7_9BURK|nr:abortive infection family protein [Trinickia dinghuensis]RDU94947.1 hypothetical protein DWV00_31265 [Trinickia dinghuensis]